MDIEIRAPFYSDLEDFTFFHRADQLKTLFVDGVPKTHESELQWDETVRLRHPSKQITLIGRLNVTRCYGGRFVSCTFRATQKIPKAADVNYHKNYHPELSGYNLNPPRDPANTDAPVRKSRADRLSIPYLSSVDTLCDIIYHRIFPSQTGNQGLVLVAGATATGKSKIARGLIYRHLVERIPSKESKERRPHLVTVEDPIDRYWAEDYKKATLTGIDYTPRELHKDVASLGDAIESVLRQTPKVFFVGETRNRDDWKTLLQFATSGHLAVTTSHAGSLTEAMGQLFRAAEANSPARRSDVTNSILALVHLRGGIVDADETRRHNSCKQVNLVVPAIWVRSPVSTKTLMADGLTALRPYRDLAQSRSGRGAGEFGSLGRNWFAEELLAKAKPALQRAFELPIRSKTLTWDLEGI